MRSLVLLLLLSGPAFAADAPAFPDLPKGVSSFGATVCDGYVYVYGGHSGKVHSYSSDTTLNTFHRLKLAEPTKWEELPGGKHLQGLALVEHKGKVIRVGGMEPRHKAGDKADIHSTASVQSFDPKTKKWTDLPDMPAARSSHDAVVAGDTLVVVGGWAMAQGKAPVWATEALTLDLADPKAKWVAQKQPFVRRALSLAFDGTNVQVVGGLTEDGGTSTAIDTFELKTGHWGEEKKLPGDKANGFSPAVAYFGSWLAVNGSDGKLYRLVAGEWEAAGAAKKARYVHRMVPLTDKKILILGGATKDGPTASCEVIELK